MGGTMVENLTHVSEEELLCLLRIEKDHVVTSPTALCPRTWDSLLCWPPTVSGTVAQLPCFSELNGIKYDTTQNATRFCEPTGTWAKYTDYADCSSLRPKQDLEPGGIEVTTMIYLTGYIMSLIALSMAVWVFLYFKDLRCLRNTIHTNLMCTYMLADFMWILTMVLQKSVQTDIAACALLIVFLHYSHLTNFFWMFVEGLYLYMLVVETFTREGIKLKAYIIIGWGTPLLIVVVWTVAKCLTDVPTELPLQGGQVLSHCPWMTSNAYDWIYQGPAVGVLAVNLLFLVMIMWVLITKLRSANNVETQQYRKATKALLVLVPLLGITYILLMAGSSQANAYTYVRAILISTQGFTVALFYCFLNTEVQNTIRHHIERWKDSRDLGAGGRRFTYTADWSPNTRTESIRLCHSLQPSSRYQKRESNVSGITMVTLVGGSSTRVSNGSVTVKTSVSPYFEHVSRTTAV